MTVLVLIAVLALLFLLTLLLLPALGRHRSRAPGNGDAMHAADKASGTDTDPESAEPTPAARRALREEGRLTLPAINFRPNEAELSQPSAALREQLAVLGDYLASQKTSTQSGTRAPAAMKVSIVGHTDRQGSREHNLALSLRRAEAIADLLAHDYDVPREHIRAIGRGFSEPVADNGTPDGRQRNRRVVVELE